MEEKDMQPMQPEGSSLTGRRIKDGARTPVAGRRSSASEEPGISGRTGNSGRSRISGNRRLVRRKPQSRRRRQRNLIIKMSVVLILLIVAVVGTFLWKKYSPSKEKADLNKYYGIEVGRTMAFLSLGMLELIHCFNIKSEESIFKVGLLKNKYLIGAFLLGTVLQLGIVFIPALAELFKLTMLSSVQWIITLIISIIPVIVMECQKKFNEIKFGKIVYSYKTKKI